MDYFAELLQKELETYLAPEHVDACHQAYLVAEEAHSSQTRRSGEPYIVHPVSAALILAKMRLDYQSIMATLLHDVFEDTSVKRDTLIHKFGPEVTALVEGVTKLTQIKFETKAHAHAEYFRKMVLAMVKDIRVIIVKLADRLHNMQTLGAMPSAKMQRIARETLDIYAPIANRLGMHYLYTSLEDLGFQALYPLRYRVLKSAVEKTRGHRKELTIQVEKDLKDALDKLGIPFDKLYGRQKHLYGIYRKMKKKKVSLAEITDVFAFRIITPSIDACYRILGVLHQTYKPLPNRFKDYIGIPKVNGYQSLHTSLFGPFGVPLEVQIRTEEMDKVAEHGIAAHLIYKSDGVEFNEAQLRAREWIQRLMDMQRSTGNSIEFIENVKVDLFPDEIYVFTPKGHILELPKGATPVDFAYTIHSGIGNTCVAAKVNRRLVPLSMPLGSGQTVEIITAPTAKPNPAWLNFVVTGKARGNIRSFLKMQHHAELIAMGKRLLEQALENWQENIEKIPQESMQALLEDLNLKHLDDVYFAVGKGEQMPMVVAKRLVASVKSGHFESQDSMLPIAIKGTEGMAIQFADCCQPIPGDAICGILREGHAIQVHTTDCKVLMKSRIDPASIIALAWDEQVSGDFWAELVVDVINERGVLAGLATAISEAESNIADIHVDPRDGRHNSISFLVSVNNRIHLARIMKKLRAVKSVSRLYRKRKG
ncbi:MAG: RelA/SpoT family protein [Gammaproteobacteria bacterium]|nr:RelA/SpoT family protein [Gammaproteobacteria bacterium]